MRVRVRVGVRVRVRVRVGVRVRARARARARVRVRVSLLRRVVRGSLAPHVQVVRVLLLLVGALRPDDLVRIRVRVRSGLG